MSAVASGVLRRALLLGAGPAGERRVSYVVGDSAGAACQEETLLARLGSVVVPFVLFVYRGVHKSDAIALRVSR